MEWIQVLTGPVLGAVIGYFTNYLAIKMMFRPLKPIKIGRYTLPFTPGIIPRGKARLAKALGDAVGERLLTQKDIEEALLSEEIKQKIEETVKTELKQDSASIQEHMDRWIGEEKREEWNRLATKKIAEKIADSLKKMKIGELIATEGSRIIKDKIAGTFLNMMVNDTLIQSIIKPVGAEAEKYLEEHGEEKIEPVVAEELNQIEQKKVEELLEDCGTNIDQIGTALQKGYEEIIQRKGKEFIDSIHISEIVKTKIQEMDVLEVEELLLSIMKKELNAVVNLGAVIGFVIGCVNLLF